MTELPARAMQVDVDLCYSAQSIRARNLPGSIDLARRAVIGSPAIEPSDSLVQAIETVLAGDPAALTPLKIDPVNGTDTPCRCGAFSRPVLVDLAIGHHLGLVLEREQAVFCHACGLLEFPDGGDACRRRLADWRAQRSAPDRIEPSLRYQTDEHPRFVQIEVSTRCNLTCEYCSSRRLPDKADLSWRQFLDTIDQIDLFEVDVIDFTGLGETTLNPLFEDMVAELRRRGPHLSLRLVSNALAAGPESWRRFVGAGLSSIAFSIDTIDPERFARQRGGGSLEKALRTAAAVGEIRRECNGSFALRLKAVLIDQPWTEAGALMRWSVAHGFDMPQFAMLDPRDNATVNYGEQSWSTRTFAQPEEAEDFERWSLDYWRALGGTCVAAAAPQRRWRHSSLGQEAQTCRWGLNSTFIALGGHVQTCCESMIDLPRHFVGSINTQGMAAAWQGDLLWNYRLPLSLGNPPPSCLGCPQLLS